MRTTLTIDDDIADALKEQARLQDRPFKQVVNDMLRRGLSPAAVREPVPEYRIVPNSSQLIQGVDPLKLNQLDDELQAGETASRPVQG
ncbi:MAG: antitoxin [Dehalococcoidia bacterium]|nr:antitoxin [Dehalococcoidia bacterium]